MILDRNMFVDGCCRGRCEETDRGRDGGVSPAFAKAEDRWPTLDLAAADPDRGEPADVVQSPRIMRMDGRERHPNCRQRRPGAILLGARQGFLRSWKTRPRSP